MKKFNFLAVLVLCVALFACNTETPEGPVPDDSDTEKPAEGDYVYLQKPSSKRGVAYDFGKETSYATEADVALLASGISWDYNWGTAPKSKAETWLNAHNVEFVPMAWSGVDVTALTNYYNAHPQQKYLLAFNEPNLTDQANMTPERAAGLWPGVKNLANDLDLKVISPAMNYGTLANYYDPFKWLDEFFAKDGVSINDVEGIAMHAYLASPSAVISYVKQFEKYNKPLWLTEFCAWDSNTGQPNSVDAQIAYMCSVVNWLESYGNVERYAWFIGRNGYKSPTAFPYMSLLTNEKPANLTKAGMVYANMSTFDKTVVYPLNKRIPAEHYRDCFVDNDNSPAITVSSDIDGKLEISELKKNMWVDYQVEGYDAPVMVRIRYGSARNNQVTVYDNGNAVGTFDLPLTDEEGVYKTIEVGPLPASSAKHVLRFEMTKGTIKMNWFELVK